MTVIRGELTVDILIKRYGVSLLSLLVCLMVSTPVLAVDCNAIKKGIQAEKDLKKRRVKVAEAIVQCPEDPMLNYKYGLSLERFRQYDKALSYYQKAVRLDPDMGQAYAGMGDVYIYLGLLDESIEAYQKAVKLMPDNERSAGRLACLSIKRKALQGGVLTGVEFIKVMDRRGKISSHSPLHLTGPVLQYQIEFVGNSDKLLPTGIKQLGAVGQAMQNDAIGDLRFEIAVHVAPSAAAMAESKKRAETIKDQLVTNFGIDPKRLELTWYGDSQPLDNLNFIQGGSIKQRVEFRKIAE